MIKINKNYISFSPNYQPVREKDKDYKSQKLGYQQVREKVDSNYKIYRLGCFKPIRINKDYNNWKVNYLPMREKFNNLYNQKEYYNQMKEIDKDYINS